MGKIQKGLEYLSQQLGKAEDVQKEIRKYSAPDDEISKGRGGEILVKGASADAVKALNESLKLDGYKGPSLNIAKVVIKAKGNYRIISFNSWRQDEIWQGRLLDKNEVEISSKHLYSTLVCFKGTLKINDKEVPEMTYVELKQNKIYNIDSSNSFVGLFEEGYA